MTQANRAIIPFEPPRLRVTQKDIARLVPTTNGMVDFERIGLSKVRFEQVMIGLVINDPSIFPAMARIVGAVDFYDLLNGSVWKAMELLFVESADINMITVEDKLRALNVTVDDRMIIEIAAAASQTPLTATPEYYARAVREASIKRRVLVAAGEIQKSLLTEEHPLDEIIHDSNRTLFRATEQANRGRDTSAAAAVGSLFDQITAAMDDPDRRVLIPSGLKSVDGLIKGFAPKEVVILGGNAGMGKTAAMLTMVYLMIQAGIPVVYFALEMTREDVIAILVNMHTGINKAAFRERRLSLPDYGKFVKAVGEVAQWSLRIYDKFDVAGMTPVQMRTELRYLSDAEGFPFEIALIDGLWLMQADEDKRSDDRPREIASIMVEVEKIAGEFAIPVVMAHQYTRAVWNRPLSKRKPQLNDLADSAAVERNAPLVIGLYRKGYYTKVIDPFETTEWHILKNRNGASSSQGDYAETRYDPRRSMYVSPGVQHVD